MSEIEIIDRLCAVTQMQSEIIKAQAMYIREELDINSHIKHEFADMRATADKQLAEIYGTENERK